MDIYLYGALKKAAEIFNDENADRRELYEVGVKIVKKLYHSSKISASISLNEYRSLYSKTLKIRSLNSLPPTEGALKKHVERVYFQCQLWHGCAVDPCNWDWKRKPRGKYIRANIFRRSINS